MLKKLTIGECAIVGMIAESRLTIARNEGRFTGIARIPSILLGSGTWHCPCSSSARMTKADDLKARMERFAIDIVNLCRSLPNTPEARRIAAQLQDASTSVGANYRAACRARSRAEFVAKIGTVVEESDESDFWLGLLVKCEIVSATAVERLRKEADELISIFVSSHRTARSRLRNRSGSTIP